MKLSAIITEYRQRMNISQREFARACDLSNSYISFLENEVNPRTGRPIVPTIDQYRKLASGMNISVHELFKLMDEDSPVNISVPDDLHARLRDGRTPEGVSDILEALERPHAGQ